MSVSLFKCFQVTCFLNVVMWVLFLRWSKKSGAWMEPGQGFVWVLERWPYRVYCCFHICLSCCFLFISVTFIGAWPDRNEMSLILISAALEVILLHFCLLTESNILWYSLIYVRKSLVFTLSLCSWFYSIYHGSYLLSFSNIFFTDRQVLF